NASHVRSATMWDVAGRAGKRVGLISVPPSYPLPAINGAVVGCMLTPPGEPVASPPALAAELGDYIVDVPPPRRVKAGPPDYVERGVAYLTGLTEQTRQRTALALRFLRDGYDVICVVFYAPHRMQHYFWPYVAGKGPDDVPEIRRGVDTTLATLDDAIGTL